MFSSEDILNEKTNRFIQEKIVCIDFKQYLSDDYTFRRFLNIRDNILVHTIKQMTNSNMNIINLHLLLKVIDVSVNKAICQQI